MRGTWWLVGALAALTADQAAAQGLAGRIAREAIEEVAEEGFEEAMEEAAERAAFATLDEVRQRRYDVDIDDLDDVVEHVARSAEIGSRVSDGIDTAMKVADVADGIETALDVAEVAKTINRTRRVIGAFR
jgi:hypothetical protein